MPKKNKQNFLENGLNLPKLEGEILSFWKNSKIFEKSLQKNRGKKAFVFYEGPPTANGRPGIHHVLARSFKDIILRYKTMRGFNVPRKGGWDTHGLPVELEVEKKLGLRSKKEIESYGIAEFNQKCRESVWEYKEEWEKLTDRMGFWLDMENPYVTYETSYVESLWWIISQFFKKGLMYKGHKIVNWCPRCGTSLSSHELGQPGGYKEVTDNSVFVKFRVESGHPEADSKNVYILSWTTTPWTLPGNVALAIGEDIKYVEVEDISTHEKYILAEERLSVLPEGSFEKVRTFPGKKLIGWRYEPLFNIKSLRAEESYKVYPAEFVTTTDGTGVVHTAVMYGEEDYNLGLKVGLPQFHTVNEEGKFIVEVPEVGGLYAKAAETEKKIFEYLKGKNNVLRVEPYKHEYPHCWRCSTPLLYYARSSWFVAVKKIKSRLLKANKDINWMPEHLKSGRFGEWLKDAKDWNFSRERYWGTPLPIWECEICGKMESIGSIGDLEKRLPHSKNGYWVMRHGHSKKNVAHIHSVELNKYPLTPKGKAQAKLAGKKLKNKKIDLIVSSDILRSRETAKIVSKETGAKVLSDDRLREVNLGVLNGQKSDLYHKTFTYKEKFEKQPEGGESLKDVRKRLRELMEELEGKHEGKNILLVTHDYPLWMLLQAGEGWTQNEALRQMHARKLEPDFAKNASPETFSWKNLPRNSTGEVDIHRPFVDEIEFSCSTKKCEGKMKRIKEVADVWFDSGSMPFAQLHYPFENRISIDKKKFFPADYISEAMDQTRGWFYTLLAVSVLLGHESPYKNVVSLGLINDKFGQKMSKSKGNVVSPWDMADKFGMDAVRWYFYSATPPGEPKNFDEAEIQKTMRRFHLMLYNSLVFLETYRSPQIKKIQSRNVLDKWIISRTNEVISETTKNLEEYDIRGAALKIETLVDDLSRWFIRRSRRRFQPERGGSYSRVEQETASYVLHSVLLEITKLIAPFSPFFSEALYARLGNIESVHLDNWPKGGKTDKKLIQVMSDLRNLASNALAKRAELGIKVRQPLQSLTIKNKILAKDKDLAEVLRDEVNVKEIIWNGSMEEELVLDTVISPELKAEGDKREFVRLVQGLRQDAGYSPKDKIEIFVETNESLRAALSRFENELKTEVGAKGIEFKKTDKFDAEIQSKFEDREIWVAIKKI